MALYFAFWSSTFLNVIHLSTAKNVELGSSACHKNVSIRTVDSDFLVIDVALLHKLGLNKLFGTTKHTARFHCTNLLRSLALSVSLFTCIYSGCDMVFSLAKDGLGNVGHYDTI